MANLNRLIEKYYREKDWDVQKINITYLRDVEPENWQPNSFAPDRWNCTRVLWQPDSDMLIMSATATTRPGVRAVDRPMNAGGTFSILHNHIHKGCWELGRHITQHSNQLALVQCDTVIGTRDGNRDYMITGDKQFDDAGGVNQHTTSNVAEGNPPDNVGGWSFGCLVGKYPRTHYQTFMPALQASGLKTFNTGIIYKDSWSEFIAKQ